MSYIDGFVIPVARAPSMIRKLASGEYRLYSRKPGPKTGKRRNLGTFPSREQAEKQKHETRDPALQAPPTGRVVLTYH